MARKLIGLKEEHRPLLIASRAKWNKSRVIPCSFCVESHYVCNNCIIYEGVFGSCCSEWENYCSLGKEDQWKARNVILEGIEESLQILDEMRFKYDG